MRALLTGVDGFIGGWLAAELIAAGHEVTGVSRRAPSPSSGSTSTAGFARVHADVGDAAALAAAVAQARPDWVFHLAAMNHIPTSFEQPEVTLSVNLIGTLHLLEAVRAHAAHATLVSVGSSAEYGDTARTLAAVTEEDALLPTSPYAVSKAAQGLLCRQAFRSQGLKTIHARPFAVIGPGKRGDALTQFAAQVVQVERGEAPCVRVGNLEPVRDFIDVRDCARALVMLAAKGVPGATYNVCSGIGASLRDLVEALGRSAQCAFEVVPDASRLRAVEDMRIVGDPTKLVAMGHVRRHDLDETVRDTLARLRAAQS